MDLIRKILHVDLDAFYASVEQLERPDLRGRPVVVGGPPNSRGVVCTASYEARKFGVHSAMPCAQAYRLCPQAIFVAPRFERYRSYSLQVRAVFSEVTDLFEPLSLDEAYLDVSQNYLDEADPVKVARYILNRIHTSTGLTASAGVAPNKLVAKIASDMEKPAGLTVVRPEAVHDFMQPLPVRKLWGVGPVTAEKLQSHGFHTAGDLSRAPAVVLERLFGRNGPLLRNLARGIDRRRVINDWKRKSSGSEQTFAHDLTDRNRMLQFLHEQLNVLWDEMQTKELRPRRLTVKVKYNDFTTITRSHTAAADWADLKQIRPLVDELLNRTDAGARPVRLLGLSFAEFADPSETVQLNLPFP